MTSECMYYREQISAMLDFELPDTAKLDAHLEICPSCREYLEMMKHLIAGIGNSEVDAPNDLCDGIMSELRAQGNVIPLKKKKFIRFPFSLAAAAVVAFMLLSPTIRDNLNPQTSGASNADKSTYTAAATPLYDASPAQNSNKQSLQRVLPEASNVLILGDMVDAQFYNTLDDISVPQKDEKYLAYVVIDSNDVPDFFNSYNFSVTDTMYYSPVDKSDISEIVSISENSNLKLYICDDEEKYKSISGESNTILLIIKKL